MSKMSDKLLRKMLYPQIKKVIDATYEVHKSTTDQPLSYEDWCGSVKRALQPTPDSSVSD